MYQYHAIKALFRVTAAALLMLAVSCNISASGLTLAEAEQLALKNDHSLLAIRARSESMSELSVAAGRLPDPQVRLGFANLPTDTFNLGQEPMTQTVIGVRQTFQRGQTRSLSTARVTESIARNNAEAEDREEQVLLAVREEFTRIYLHQERRQILQQSLLVFQDLVEITRDYYATGRAHQQDIVQAQLELSRVTERLARIAQQEDEARARLAGWIEADAYRDLHPGWPKLPQPRGEQEIVGKLLDHPRLRAWSHEISRSRKTEDIARQAYKPGFAVDLAYGARSGQNPDGSERSDMLSVFVTMDVPLFTKNRQDRVLASRIADTSATEFARDDIYRSMKASVREHLATLARQQERLALYEQYLLPQAAFNAETAYAAYQDAVDDLTTLMRARIGEYELKLSHADLRAEETMTRARLHYLQGENS
jgi:outer membrane protein TolC